MKTFSTLALITLFTSPFISHALNLSSTDIAQGKHMTKAHLFNGFGCEGKNLSPQLAWSNAPQGTKSFALTVYDPDAPTGSGWWHWQVINIPANVSELKAGIGASGGAQLPSGALQVKNDYGIESFGGACPPSGHGVHRYQFTVHALSVEKLSLPEDPSSALVGYMINANSLASATIEALYKRD
ncbi:YbhB/YbcL family Raf kinase inhibitor-like protein [Pseudoalteromonas sp. T1lg23B]|uniref:YbhB/YbcL family Raf kinase inhibitor-like protein n=1 Tax=Pseudoalteromonas sp. T1lg23B TaxID=2077097 RepID=UPI000CF6C965|nr:YbhB/YbcL family Raf kinase inhibitor-like protein [Pseudoalteromonas sp. T1lg23B]